MTTPEQVKASAKAADSMLKAAVVANQAASAADTRLFTSLNRLIEDVLALATTPTPPPTDPTPDPKPPAEPDTPPTEPEPPAEPTTPGGSTAIWVTPAHLMSLPMSGPAWDRLRAKALAAWDAPNMDDLLAEGDTDLLAGAIYTARTGDREVQNKCVAQIRRFVAITPSNRALEAARNGTAVFLSASVMKLATVDPALFRELVAWGRKVLNQGLQGHSGGSGIRGTALNSPTNWGTMSMAFWVAWAALAGETAELETAWKVFMRWTGDNFSSTTLRFSSTNWHTFTDRKAGINPAGHADKEGLPPEDMRRGAEFKMPPTPTGYLWEMQQGAWVAAWLFHMAGKPVKTVGNSALLRLARASKRIGWVPTGDDLWLVPIIGALYGSAAIEGFNLSTSADVGKNCGWTPVTHIPLIRTVSVKQMVMESGVQLQVDTSALQAAMGDMVSKTVGSRERSRGRTALGPEDDVAEIDTADADLDDTPVAIVVETP